MKYKKLSFFAILCLSFTALALLLTSCNSFSETEYAIVEEGLIFDIYTYDKYENSTVRITGIDGMPKHLIIPEKINGMTVVEIADGAFADNDILLYLELPKGSIKLGKEFCSGSLALTGINLSGSVSVIPENAFEGCLNLARIDGTEGITTIESQAFAGCSALPSLAIPETLTFIGDEAFRGCTALSSIRIPSSVTFIGESAFWGCDGLAAAEMLCSAEIPEFCFLGCTSLTSVKIGNNVTAINNEAFRNCRALYSIEIGKNCKTIGDYAFHACDQLTEIVFADKANVSINEGNEALSGQNKEAE
jgi:hypothetical protein